MIESAGFVTITVLRTNGSYGSVSVDFKTQNGYTNDPNIQTAIAGMDYTAVNSNLNFADEELRASFQVPIY